MNHKLRRTNNIIFMLLICLVACNPISERNKYLSGTIAIKSRILNPRSIINIGDSVTFSFEVPDTIELNGTRIKAVAGNVDGANIGLDACKIIPGLPGGFSNIESQTGCKVWSNPGTLTSNKTLVFANINGNSKATFYIIPKQKGVYFFWQTQEGYIDLNNGGIKARFSFNFGNINRNHQVLVDSAGAVNNFGLFMQGQNEVYGFEVK